MDLTIAQARQIIEQIAAGGTLKEMLRDFGGKHKEFYALMRANPDLDAEYTAAKQSRIEVYVEEMVDIADNEPDPQRARVMVDVRKWVASKLRPEIYGDRVDVKITGRIDLAAAVSEARQRLARMHTLPVSDQSEAVDVSPTLIEERKRIDETSVPALADLLK